MELLKKNIHMDRVRLEGVNQFTLEDDLNIPDSKPDVGSINLEKGMVIIDEMQPSADLVTVRGRLTYAVLYQSGEEEKELVLLEGGIPFEEKIHMQGVTPQDTLTITAEPEDLSVGIINSRKLRIQSLLTLQAMVQELYDVEVPIGVNGTEKVEYRRLPVTLTQLRLKKNDIFRMKEEMLLPMGYPNIYRILWKSVSLKDVEFRPMEDQIAIRGEGHMFVLYEGETENRPIQVYSTTFPINGHIDCQGCREDGLTDVTFTECPAEFSVRPDLDGEERCIGLEMAIELCIRLYEEENMEILTDIYGVSKDVSVEEARQELLQILSRITGRTKVTDHLQVEGVAGPVLQVLYSEGRILDSQMELGENSLNCKGLLRVKALYIAGNDQSPYGCVERDIPYQYHMDIPGMNAGDRAWMKPRVEQLQITMLDGEELDVRAVLAFDTMVFHPIIMNLIERLTLKDLESSVLNNLPGMVIYKVKEGDNLWSIGKKYYISVDAIKELNALSDDTIYPGQKLLIIKGA